MWYRKAIDTSKSPFDFEEPEVKLHPLLKKLHEKIESGEMSEKEFFPTLVNMAKDFPEILDSVSPPLKATVLGILNQTVAPANFVEDLLTRGLDFMHPQEIDEVQERLEQSGIKIDAKEREIIPLFRKIANQLDSEWFEIYENDMSQTVDEHFKNFIVYKIPVITYELSKITGQRIDKDKIEDLILLENYNNDEEVRNKLEIIFMKIYLQGKQQKGYREAGKTKYYFFNGESKPLRDHLQDIFPYANSVDIFYMMDRLRRKAMNDDQVANLLYEAAMGRLFPRFEDKMA